MPVVAPPRHEEAEETPRPSVVTPAYIGAGACPIDGDIVFTGRVSGTPRNPITGNIVFYSDVITESDGTDFRIEVCDNFGFTIAWLDQAVFGNLTVSPSKPHQWSFTMPHNTRAESLWGTPDDYGIGEPFREVRIWYGNRVLTWGPCVPPELRDGIWSVQGGDCGYYLDRRTIGPIISRNLDDSDIDGNGVSDWFVSVAVEPPNLIGPYGAQYVAVDGHPLYGTQALHVHHEDQTGTVPYFPLAWKDLRLNASAFPHRVTFSARVYVDVLGAPNHRQSGLVLAAFPVGYTTPYEGAFKFANSTISVDHPSGMSGGSIYHEVSIDIPPATECVIHYRLEGPIGDTYYDDIWLEYDAALEFSGEDQTSDIALKLVDHLSGKASPPFLYSLQHPNYPWVPEIYGWSDVHIDVDAPASGIKRSRRYFFHQHTTGTAALDEFAKLDDGFEWKMVYTATKRSFVTSSPKLGDTRKDLPLRSADGHGNILGFAFTYQGAQAGTHVVVSASKDSRRQGVAADTTEFANGLNLVAYLQATVDTPIEALDSFAARRLASTIRPVTLVVTLDLEPYLSRGLWIGDKVPVRINHGWFSVDSYWRIVQLDISGTRHLVLTMNPIENS